MNYLESFEYSEWAGTAPPGAQGVEAVAAVNRVGTIPCTRSAVGAAQLTWEWLRCWKFPLWQ